MDCSDQQDTMCLGTYNISPPHPLSLAPNLLIPQTQIPTEYV